MQIEIGNNDLNPWLPGNGSFGLYNWRQNVVQGNPLPWNAPFTDGAKYRPLRRARPGVRDGQRHAPQRLRPEPQQRDEHDHRG